MKWQMRSWKNFELEAARSTFNKYMNAYKMDNASYPQRDRSNSFILVSYIV